MNQLYICVFSKNNTIVDTEYQNALSSLWTHSSDGLCGYVKSKEEVKSLISAYERLTSSKFSTLRSYRGSFGNAGKFNYHLTNRIYLRIKKYSFITLKEISVIF